MLTKITDDLYIDLSDIVYFDIDRKLRKTVWKTKSNPFDFTASHLVGDLIKKKIKEYLEFALIPFEPSEEYKKIMAEFCEKYREKW